MLSNTGAYAVRAMLHLAERAGEGPVRVDDVAAGLEVPRNYLSKVLHTLVAEGVLRSARGPHGGFELARPASEVTLLEVVAPFEAMDGARSCLLRSGACDEADPCALHDRWGSVAAEVAGFFRETVLADVLGDAASVGRILEQERS